MTAPQDPFSTPPPSDPDRGATPAYGAAPQQGAPVFGSAPTPRGSRNGLGIAALVLGILAVLSGLFFIGGLLGVAAVVLGVLGRGRAKRGEASNGGMAVAGIVLGVLGILLTVAVIAGVASFLRSDTGQELQECLESAGNDVAAQEQCQTDTAERLTEQQQ